MKNKMSVTSFKEKGFVEIGYPKKLRVAVEDAIVAWRAFCVLPEERKILFPYNPNDGMGVGYELKKTKGIARDLKEDLHVTTGQSDWLAEAAKKSGVSECQELVKKAQSLLLTMSPIILDFAKSIEQKFGIKYLVEDVADNQEQWFLRFLHYFGDRKVGEEIATSHADKSGFTLHLYESDSGLQFLDWDLTWHDAHVSPGTAVIIPGMRMQYRSENKLKALFHRVIANEKTAKNGRFSMVCFVHFKRTPQYDKKNVGRLQEFKPGFNYEMPFEEFRKLFV